MVDTTTKMYPHFTVDNNKKPNRLYAFPLLGILIKIIILIPQFVEMFFLGIAAIFLLIINWFIVLFTGEYWDLAYNFFLGIMRLEAKMHLFLYGLTDTYPGFALNTKNLFTLTIPKPTNPNRILAIPLIGIIVRFILLIPYLIFNEVLGRGAGIAMVCSWFAVLFNKQFPESLYEFERDTLRVSFASSSYILGFSDHYPNFKISMNHQTIKLLLIIAGAICLGLSWGGSDQNMNNNTNYRYQYNNYHYQNSPSQQNFMMPQQEVPKGY
jgi:hypothetical protein